MCLLVLKLLNISCWSCILACLQEHNTNEFVAIEEIRFRTVIWNGNQPRLRSMEFARVNTSMFRSTLEQDEFKQEIGLNEKQQTELDKLVELMQTESIRLGAEWTDRHPTKAQKNELRKIQTSIQNSLNEILLPFQITRIDEIKNRLEIRSGGLQQFLAGSQIAGMDISLKEIQTIDRVFTEVAKQIKLESVTVFNKSIENILSPLGMSQREQFDEVREQTKFLIQDFDIHVAQLKYGLAIKDDFGIGSTEDKLFEALLDQSPTFMITFDGSFKAIQTGNTDPIKVPEFIKTLALAPENALAITDEQRSEMVVATDDYRAAVKRQQAIRGRGVVTDSIQKEFNRALGLEAEKLNKKYEDVLLPHQLGAVRLLFSKALVPKYGLVANLLAGDLGRDLELSKKQKDKIRTVSQSELEKLEKKLVKWDRQLFDDVRKGLTDDNRKLFDAAIGDPLQHIIPTINALISNNN